MFRLVKIAIFSGATPFSNRSLMVSAINAYSFSDLAFCDFYESIRHPPAVTDDLFGQTPLLSEMTFRALSKIGGAQR